MMQDDAGGDTDIEGINAAGDWYGDAVVNQWFQSRADAGTLVTEQPDHSSRDIYLAERLPRSLCRQDCSPCVTQCRQIAR